MAMSLQAMKTLFFNAGSFIDDVGGITTTEAVDLSKFVGDAYIIVSTSNQGSDVEIASVFLQDNFSVDPGDSAEWAAVVGGTFERGPNPEDVYNFHSTIVIPIDKLRRYIRVRATTTGTFTVGDIAVLFATGAALPQYRTDAVKYAVAVEE